jgi:hypothetical protein
MGKRITDNDAFAGGIAAYAMMQSLLKRLEETGTPLQVIRDIIENAARSLELVSQQMRPKHPAMGRAILLLRGSAVNWKSLADMPQTADGQDANLSHGLSTISSVKDVRSEKE